MSISEKYNLNDCGGCKHWIPNNSLHLCEFGSCNLNKEHPIQMKRSENCDSYVPVTEEDDG